MPDGEQFSRLGSNLWKATRKRPDSPDLILHIEVGVPPLGGLGRPVTKHEEPSPHKLARTGWRPRALRLCVYDNIRECYWREGRGAGGASPILDWVRGCSFALAF